MSGAIFGIPGSVSPAIGQGLGWDGYKYEPRSNTGAASALTGMTVNQIAVGTAGGGLTGSAALTFDGTTFGVNAAALITGIVSLSNTTSSVSPSTGALVITGGLGVTGTCYFGGVLKSTVGTAATSTITGSFQVSGGLGVSAAIYCGEGIHAGSTGWDQTNAASELVIGRSGTAAISNATCAFLGWLDATHPLNTSGTNGHVLLYARNAGSAGISFATANTNWMTLSVAGQLNLTATTAATNPTTGALVVGGGIGATGAIFSASQLGVRHATNPFLSLTDTTTSFQGVWEIASSEMRFAFNSIAMMKVDSSGNVSSARPWAFTSATALSVGSTTLLQTSVALTNGAAAAAGTLLNAPAAGNPTKWIPINDNGTTRYIPAW